MTFQQARMDEFLAEYHRKRARASELHRKLGEISVSSTASRNVVKVTVNGQSQVTGIEFPTAAYKRMPAAELVKSIMDTIGAASVQATAAVSALMTPELPPGLNFVEMLRGKTDIATILPAETAIPEEVRDYIGYEPGEFSEEEKRDV